MSLADSQLAAPALPRRLGSLKGQALVTLVSNGLLGATAVATGVLSARLLGPAGKGELSIVMTFPVILGTVGSLGLGQAAIYNVARRGESGASYALVGWLFMLALSLPVMLAGWVLAPALFHAQRPGTIAAVRHYLPFVLLTVLMGPAEWIFRGRQQVVRWNATRILAPLLWLGVLGFAWILHLRRVETVATAYLVVLTGGSLVLLGLVAKDLRGAAPPEWKRLKPMLRFGLPVVLGTGSRALNMRLDLILMGAILAPRLVGLYAVASAWAMLLSPITQALAAVLFPKVGAARDHGARVALAGRAALWAAAVNLVVAALVLAATGTVLPWLFGQAFAGATPYAAVLAIGGGVLATNQVVDAGLRGLGRTKPILVAELAGLVVTLVGLALLLRRYGLWGAVATSMAAYCTTGLVLAVALWRACRPPRDGRLAGAAE